MSDMTSKLAGAQPASSKAGQPWFDIPASIVNGDTADVYFHRTLEVLRGESIDPLVTMEVFP